MAGNDITILCDNQAIVQVINQASTGDDVLLHILRAITLLSLQIDLYIHTRHVPGISNVAANSLSHSQARLEFLKQHSLLPVMS